MERLTDKGVRRIDARAAVVELDAHDTAALETAGLDEDPATGPCAILRVVVRHPAPAVRPDDVYALR